MFEDGHLTDGLGNRVNFKNTIVIMTSNIGARFIQKRASMGFQSADVHDVNRNMSDLVLSEVRRTFNPEFINRIDEIIVFEPLSDDDLRRILSLLVEQVNANLVDRRIRLDVTPEALNWMIERDLPRPVLRGAAAPAGDPAVYRGSAVGRADSGALEERGDRGVPGR